MNSLKRQCSFSMFRQRSKCETRLFCFPYAGAAGSIYRPWATALPEKIQVCGATLPGRDFKLSSMLCDSIGEIVEAMIPVIRPLLSPRFALFGHSLGSLVAFELACHLQADYGESMVHLFVSGHQAPQLPHTRSVLHALPEQEFIQEIKLLNGTPREVWEQPDLMNLLLPLLRRDFRLVETYEYTSRPPLTCPITAFGGNQDTEADAMELDLWRFNTVGPFKLTVFPGDHFFIHSAQDSVVKEIEESLKQRSGKHEEAETAETARNPT